VHEEKPADHGICGTRERDPVQRLGPKVDPIETFFRRATSRVRNDLRVFVHADYRTTRADSLGHEQRNVGQAAPQNQNAHARRDPRTRKQLFAERLRKGRLRGVRTIDSCHAIHCPSRRRRTPRRDSHFATKTATVTESLADVLRLFRSAAHLSQEALAERSGLSTRTVSDIETGSARTPRLITIMLLAEALGLSASERSRLQEAARKPAAQGGAAAPRASALPAVALIGRDADVARLCALLSREGVRLVTLDGTAGVGKTSLAIRVAAERATGFELGVAFAELALPGKRSGRSISPGPKPSAGSR